VLHTDLNTAIATRSMATYRTTRRSILIGAVATLICAPAVVRATSLMPVRGFSLQSLNQLGEFYRRCFYHSLDSNLRAGRTCIISNGKIIPAAEVRRMVAYARVQGWLTLDSKPADSRGKS
jgi:hypothetical protein